MKEGFFGGSDGKEASCLQFRRPKFDPWVRKTPWRREWQPTLVFLPEKSHGRGAWQATVHKGHKESDTTEWLTLALSFRWKEDKMLWLEAKMREFGASGKYLEQKQKRAGLHSRQGRGSRMGTDKKRGNHRVYMSRGCFSCLVAQSWPTLCNSMDCRMPRFPVLHYLLEFVQAHVHWVSDIIQPSHPLSSLLLLPSIFHSIRVFSNELRYKQGNS